MMLGHRGYAALIGCAILAVACEDERPPGISGFDAGRIDVPVIELDKGPPVDRGLPPDAGSPVDTGPVTDRGSMDATAADAGDVPPGEDVPPTMRAAFRPISPRSGEWMRSRRPTFRWTAMDGATGYRVEVGRSRSIEGVVGTYTTTTATEVTADQDLPEGRHYWRVTPLLATGTGAPSPSWQMVLGHAPCDFDGDGHSDVAAGAPGAPTMTGRGRVLVFTGGPSIDRTPDLTLEGETGESRFGVSVSMRGDLNNDGFADLVVGAPFHPDGTNVGRVYVYLGGRTPSNRPAVTLSGMNEGSDFGRSVAIVGDINADGYDDFVVGSSRQSAQAGRAFLFLGGATISAMPAVVLGNPMPGDQFGYSVSAAGDLNGDGLADWLVGAPRADLPMRDGGAVYVYLGGLIPDGFVDRTLTGTLMDEFFGSSLGAGPNDLDNDGYADFAVGSPARDVGGSNAGTIQVFAGGSTLPSGPRQAILGTRPRNNGERLGFALAAAGDVNGDGSDDLLVGAPLYSTTEDFVGRIYLYRGGGMLLNTTPLATWEGEVGQDNMGGAVGGAGDTDGDGLADILLSAPAAPFMGRYGPGTIYLHPGGRTTPGARRFSYTGSLRDDVGTSVTTR